MQVKDLFGYLTDFDGQLDADEQRLYRRLLRSRNKPNKPIKGA